jgi:hypothetical protein
VSLPKQELKERFMAAIDHINRHPVVHTWTYKLDLAARHDSIHGNDGLD